MSNLCSLWSYLTYWVGGCMTAKEPILLIWLGLALDKWLHISPTFWSLQFKEHNRNRLHVMVTHSSFNLCTTWVLYGIFFSCMNCNLHCWYFMFLFIWFYFVAWKFYMTSFWLVNLLSSAADVYYPRGLDVFLWTWRLAAFFIYLLISYYLRSIQNIKSWLDFYI